VNAVSTVKLTIDDTVYEARPGETILQVARRCGIGDRIPTLCYEPALPPYTSCFVCVVEQEGVGKLIPGCSTPVSEGMVIRTRTERVTKARKTALELLLSNHPADCVAPCSRGCPAGVDVQQYLQLARAGKYEEAVRVIRERNPLPVVCGRVCVRRCEEVCRRAILDDAVGINMVKRAAADWWLDHPYAESVGADTGKRVAVVGGGPAGLTAAYYLRLAGHGVTLFEAQEALGGMLRWGIPDYRLPRPILDQEIGEIVKLGVEVRTGADVGASPSLDELRKGHDAVFLAIGAQGASAARIKGEESLLSGIGFLADVKRGKAPDLRGKKVAVIGGGNTAIDAARTALRLASSHVTIVYRRTRKEMPANVEEIEAAEHERIRMEFLIAPVGVKVEDGVFRGIVCQKMQLGEPDKSGRRRPVPVPDSEHLVACDVAIGAIGQQVELRDLVGHGTEPERDKWGNLAADTWSCATGVDGVFAGGDASTGPAVAIDAIAWGRRAALSIDQYLAVGRPARVVPGFSSRKENFGEIRAADLPAASAVRRAKQGERPVDERIAIFEEVEETLDDAQVRQETERCLQCGCSAAADCELRALADRYGLGEDVRGQTIRHRLDHSHPRIAVDPNKCILCTRCVRTCGDILGVSVLGLVNRGFETVIAPTLGRKLVDTECIACGNCVDACPTGTLAFTSLALTAPAVEEVRTVCTLCGEACPAVLARNEFGFSLRPVEDADGRRGLFCELGRFGSVALLADADRLTRPLVRRRGKLVPVSWDEAVDAAVAGLRKAGDAHGKEALLVAAGGDLSAEEAAWAARFAREALGARVGSLALIAQDAEIHALEPLMGRTRSTASFEDLERADVILAVGDDPMEGDPIAGARFRRAIRNGARVIAITSAPTRTAAAAAVRLEARRGTHGLVLAWILARVLEKRGVAAALGKAAAAVTDGRLESECGVTAASAREAVDLLLAAAGPVVGSCAPDVRAERSPGAAAWLALLVDALRPAAAGSGWILPWHLPNVEGLRWAGALPADAAAAAETAATVRGGAVRAAWVIREDPDESSELAAALGKLEFLVVQDLHLTATAARADVVIPASLHFETGGTFVRSDGTVERVAAAAPLAVERSTEAVLRAAAARAGKAIESAPLPEILVAAAAGSNIGGPFAGLRAEAPAVETGFFPPARGTVHSAAAVARARLRRRGR
jgi:formate dehydrogenase major subunit